MSAIAEERPDLLLLDINLPDRTGWDVLRELNRRDSGVPTIVMSAVRARPSRLDEFAHSPICPSHFRWNRCSRLVLEPAAEPDAGDEA